MCKGKTLTKFCLIFPSDNNIEVIYSVHIYQQGTQTCVAQHMGRMALRPILRTKQWLNVLLKDTVSRLGFEPTL